MTSQTVCPHCGAVTAYDATNLDSITEPCPGCGRDPFEAPEAPSIGYTPSDSLVYIRNSVTDAIELAKDLIQDVAKPAELPEVLLDALAALTRAKQAIEREADAHQLSNPVTYSNGTPISHRLSLIIRDAEGRPHKCPYASYVHPDGTPDVATLIPNK
ncbi:hypothetical protein EJK80_02405 [Corynebacterium phoceense]|uniref:Uncharacterized protein n=1 Tax=Corynebacterium phoceense TaxID=1686286 RepID=A0A540R9N2_9CORY|nr:MULTISPECIES: hypothetical protein [Corynebacterium]OFL77025.1 hypothetical protein HMPREF2748_05595 [Corynebacterium sp. HMSC077B05]TQE44449.1 hypothetical protein EJK80_02405 [Corynebacterium phoceense]